jgi:hypothetical protein
MHDPPPPSDVPDAKRSHDYPRLTRQ